MGKAKKEHTLDERIEKAQEKVFRYAEPYNKAVAELKALLDEKNKSRQDLLLEAVAKSKRSYEEIMEFIKSDPEDDPW